MSFDYFIICVSSPTGQYPLVVVVLGVVGLGVVVLGVVDLGVVVLGVVGLEVVGLGVVLPVKIGKNDIKHCSIL